ncbi:MAG: hypothetical protein H0T51_04655 [Pirellulales bacterium]|nr:hypothetical protein [Pirellulales bacterium]
MPSQSHEPRKLSQFTMGAVLFGQLRPEENLRRQTHRALKSHHDGRDFFSEITLNEDRHGGMRIDFTVTASALSLAELAGAVYLSQLCDLLSVLTQAPVWFYTTEEEARNGRNLVNRRVATVDRILTEPEWNWITGYLVFLQREHSKFLSAASWYRKALIGHDSLEDFCCFWRVIERLAYSYADRSQWSDEERMRSPAKKCVGQLVSDLFVDGSAPAILTDQGAIKQIVELRNDLSHGNIPITLEVIDLATSHLKVLEDAAFSVLQRVKHAKLPA